jgi:hypothetical protein
MRGDNEIWGKILLFDYIVLCRYYFYSCFPLLFTENLGGIARNIPAVTRCETLQEIPMSNHCQQVKQMKYKKGSQITQIIRVFVPNSL